MRARVFRRRKLQLLAPVLGRKRAAHPGRNRVHDVVYRVPAGEERDLSAEVGCDTLKWMLPSPRWPKQETREPGSTASPAHAKRCEPGAIPHGSPAPRQARAETAPKQRHEQPWVDRACGTS